MKHKSIRNNNCPCGSGFKYKKCCLPKEKKAYNDRVKDDECSRFPVKKLGKKLKPETSLKAVV